MPIINENLFVEAMLERRYRLPVWFGDECAAAQVQLAIKRDRASALEVLRTIREAVIRGVQMGKSMRPWDVNPKIFDTLDKNQPWWGFEFETGWRTREAMRTALTYVWDNYDGCMFDGEGEGAFPVEITFIPANLQDYKDGTASATKFMQWVNDNQQLVYAGGANDVGCHWNVSTPKFRRDIERAKALCRFLNRTLANTRGVNGQRLKMFGRETIYAGFFVNYSGAVDLEGRADNVWLEMKGFRTAYNINDWNNYLSTCTALQKLIDYFFDNTNECVTKSCVNLYDIAFNGAEVKIGPNDSVRPAVGALPLYSRPYGPNAGCIV